MPLHRLRLAVGEEDFFTILQEWADEFEGGNVTTARFVGLAEKISGEELSPLFRRWLFTRGKPVVAGAAAVQERSTQGIRSETVAEKRLRMSVSP